jgi:hypothetical protein
MADPTYVRMYQKVIERKQQRVHELSTKISARAWEINKQASKGKVDNVTAREIRSLALELADAAAALDALEEVSYLTIDPDTEENTHG